MLNNRKISKSKNYKSLVDLITKENFYSVAIDIHFDFLDKEKNGFFLESVNYSTNYYGTALSDVCDSKYVIVDPTGLKNYKAKNIDCKVFYLDASEEVRALRMKKRKDKEADIAKRLELDRNHFSTEIKKMCDYIISVDEITVDEVATKINELYKK